MLTVILSEIAAVNIDAACCMPARKLAGAAMAAASNWRLIVMPPDVSATTETGPLCTFSAATASLDRAGVGIFGGTRAREFPPKFAAEARKIGSTSSPAPRKKLSEGSCGLGMNLDFIAQPSV